MPISVKTVTGRTIVLDVQGSDTIEQVDAKLRVHLEGDVYLEHKYRIFGEGKVFWESRVGCPRCGDGRGPHLPHRGPYRGSFTTLSDLNIQTDSTLHFASCWLRGGGGPALPRCVIVKTPPGQMVAVPRKDCYRENGCVTVKDVKREIYKEWRTPVERQVLLFGDRVLEDDVTLDECGVGEVHYCKACNLCNLACNPREHTLEMQPYSLEMQPYSLEMQPSALTVSVTPDSGQLAVSITNLAGEEQVAFQLSAETATVGSLNQSVLNHCGPGFILVTGDGKDLTGCDDLLLEEMVVGA